MTPPPSRQFAAAAVALPATPGEAQKLAETLMEVMTALLEVIERETELVRAGKVREAMALETKKSELSRRYVGSIAHLKNSHTYLAGATPDLLAALHRHHDTFRALLQINLTVLATAHAVSEGIVRGVNIELQRRNIPTTYTASGQRAAPSPRNISPLALSRSL